MASSTSPLLRLPGAHAGITPSVNPRSHSFLNVERIRLLATESLKVQNISRFSVFDELLEYIPHPNGGKFGSIKELFLYKTMECRYRQCLYGNRCRFVHNKSEQKRYGQLVQEFLISLAQKLPSNPLPPISIKHQPSSSLERVPLLPFPQPQTHLGVSLGSGVNQVQTTPVYSNPPSSTVSYGQGYSLSGSLSTGVNQVQTAPVYLNSQSSTVNYGQGYSLSGYSLPGTGVNQVQPAPVYNPSSSTVSYGQGYSLSGYSLPNGGVYQGQTPPYASQAYAAPQPYLGQLSSSLPQGSSTTSPSVSGAYQAAQNPPNTSQPYLGQMTLGLSQGSTPYFVGVSGTYPTSSYNIASSQNYHRQFQFQSHSSAATVSSQMQSYPMLQASQQCSQTIPLPQTISSGSSSMQASISAISQSLSSQTTAVGVETTALASSSQSSASLVRPKPTTPVQLVNLDTISSAEGQAHFVMGSMKFSDAGNKVRRRASLSHATQGWESYIQGNYQTGNLDRFSHDVTVLTPLTLVTKRSHSAAK